MERFMGVVKFDAVVYDAPRLDAGISEVFYRPQSSAQSP